jgi:Cytotoxic translational repressor of toxin-antitoxin stability system
MKVEFNKRFIKDFKVLPEYAQKAVKEIYGQISLVSTLFDIPDCKKLHGNNNFFRIRFGDYRLILLLYISGDTVEFRRVLSRGQVYKKHNI